MPYFCRQESWEGGADAYRGGEGPLTTAWSGYQDPLVEAYAAAGAAAGHPTNEDYNGEEQEGFGRWQATIRNGRRCSAAVAYLRPALGRPGLSVVTDALATRIVLDGTRAVGVEYDKKGAHIVSYAEREIVLAGGVINSPQLLMLSGIGPPEMLKLHGIPVQVPLPGVGRNLQDHISAGILWRRNEAGPLHAKMRLDRIAREVAKTYFFGTGITSNLPGGVMAFLKSKRAGKLPDIQLLFAAAPMLAKPYFEPFTRPYQDSFGCRAVVLRPESRGFIELISADPHRPPRIRQNFLSTEDTGRHVATGTRRPRWRLPT